MLIMQGIGKKVCTETLLSKNAKKAFREKAYLVKIIDAFVSKKY